jgi:alpha-tubulin suppressor-like RCC1 family protein
MIGHVNWQWLSGNGVQFVASHGATKRLKMRVGWSSKVVSWGANDYGQCDNPISTSTGITAIAAGSWHGLAISATGGVIAWGRNDYGQSTVPQIAMSNVIAVAAGRQHSIALLASGRVIAWGDNSKHQLDVPIQATSGVTKIACGYYHCLALLPTGQVVQWGDNTKPTSTTASRRLSQTTTGTAILWGTDVYDIAAGGYTSVALQGSGDLVAYDQNGDGQVTVLAPASMGLKTIAVGSSHILAIKPVAGETSPVASLFYLVPHNKT